MEGHTRKYIRLKNYDYSSNGLYFITICAQNRNHFFSEITEDPQCVGEADVIMPDHIHMILFISDYETENGGRPGAASPTKSVNQIINGLKTISTKQIGFSVWQRSFHDHIIRNEREFLEICNYIDNNPINWVNDIYNQNFWR